MTLRGLTGMILTIVVGCGSAAYSRQAPLASPVARTLDVNRTDDFAVDGTGRAAAWSHAAWEALHPRTPEGGALAARFKMLYSGTGLYVLLEGEDRVLTATKAADYLDLWREDVFEVFLWPDEQYPVYFEYEISPLGFELPILVPNLGGAFHGWLPWGYEGARKTRKATSVAGGPRVSGARITGWTAEVFVPYDLLRPLPNVPPAPGTRWRANVYRMDYDQGKGLSWDWARVGPSFHEFRKFGTIVFK
jgi:hypothetical protein